jgi:hypothetical protein
VRGAVAPGHERHRHEHLCGQVGGHLGVARLAGQKADDSRQVAAVEVRECLAVAVRDRAQQVLIGPTLEAFEEPHHAYIS